MARRVDQVGESAGLAFRGGEPLGGQTVVAATVVIGLVMEGDGQLLNQAVDEHPLNRAIERAWAETRLAVGEALDVLHDAVAVRLAVSERQQDVEDGRRQERRRLLPGIRLLSLRRGCNHGGYIYRGVNRLSSRRQRSDAR